MIDARPSGVRWQIFGLSCATSWTLYVHRYAFGLAMPALAREWDIPLADLGAMQSAFYASYLAFQIPSGLLADAIGTHLFLGGVILAWSAVLALHAWAPDARAMYGVRLLFGAAQAGCYPALGKVTQAWFPVAIRTSLQGWIASFFGRLGGGSANLVVGSVMLGWLQFDWRTAFVVLAIGGGALGVAVLAVFRNSPAQHPGVNAAELRLIAGDVNPPPDDARVEPPSISPARDADGALPAAAPRWWRWVSGRSAVNLACFLAQTCAATLADSIYPAWIPYFLSTEHDLDYAAMGLYAALPLIGGALGGMTGGYLNDIFIRALGRRWGRSIVGFGGNAVACGLLFLALAVYRDPYAFCWVLFAAKFFSDWGQPTVWGTVTDISGRYTATIFGLANGVGGVGGLIGPAAFGLLAQYYSWPAVFTTVGVTYMACALCWLLVDCTIPVFSDEPKR